ncbi:SDR family NAD(P)-dependent oxidoreductase [Rheinheimera sp.]|uniref:SDR family NAD(P)-dependent oxidoreductase n=1 Tax=Rheinheimera sp. TaxID=1869214 RepID=UPI00307D2FC4
MNRAGKAMITGASSGIGAVYADQLAARGLNLILVARDHNRLEAIAQRLRHTYSVEVSCLGVDLTQAAGLEQTLALLEQDLTLTMLVNSAGISPKDPVLESEEQSLAAMVNLNVNVLHRLTIRAAKVFSSRSLGAIINIASVVALMPEKFNGSYSASKSFVLVLTQALAGELALHGVQIQAVLPGFTRTELFERAGIDISVIPPDMLMNASELVEAALIGFERGELVTIPSLVDLALWRSFEHTRQQLAPYLSLQHPAPRYFNTPG